MIDCLCVLLLLQTLVADDDSLAAEIHVVYRIRDVMMWDLLYLFSMQVYR